jgi:hypothetical protein
VLWCHIPNGGSRNAIEGAKLKRMGVLPGMPDIMIFEKNKVYSGCAIELKVKPNRPTNDQQRRLSGLSIRGWFTIVAYDFDEAKKQIDYYFTL